jgi:hypothetical protein
MRDQRFEIGHRIDQVCVRRLLEPLPIVAS